MCAEDAWDRVGDLHRRAVQMCSALEPSHHHHLTRIILPKQLTRLDHVSGCLPNSLLPPTLNFLEGENGW